MVSAIIMASGSGSRMGKDKLMLPYRYKTFVQHTIEKVMACDFNSRVIVAKDEYIIDLARTYGLKAIKNRKASIGQSESIKLGIENSKRAEGYMFFTADQPLLDVETINLLKDTFEKNNESIIVPTFKGEKGSPVIFPHRFIDELRCLNGDVGGRIVINNNLNKVKFVEVREKNILFDVDTEEDYERLLSIKE